MSAKHVWLIGAGGMAREYIKVLAAKKAMTTVIGRGEASAEAFESASGHAALSGGLEKFLATGPELPDAVIVSVSTEQHFATAKALIEYGVKNILLEKPGGASVEMIRSLAALASEHGIDIPLAYNRRFYASVLTAKRMIREDGGVRSFTFEFTEWGNRLVAAGIRQDYLRFWFMANSTHVTDLAFFLAGDPEKIVCGINGELPWHPSGAIFTGSGVSVLGAPFSYFADWGAPGRWGVEILTAKRRFILRPLEQLHVQMLDSVMIQPVEADDGALDIDFKPGLFRQVESFLDNRLHDFRMLSSQARLVDEVYVKMAGY